MAGSRRYRLLCPIARALDRVGDRWTLLILRDLHAGPARFSDLQNGLKGIASNLLTERLQQLADDGLIEKRDTDLGVAVYALTDEGRRTRNILFELALFGGRFAPDENLTRPGNLRTVAVTMAAAGERIATPEMNFTAGITVDGEPFTLTVGGGNVDMWSGRPESPDVDVMTSYEPMVAAAEGEIGLTEFVTTQLEIAAHTPGKETEVMAFFAGVMSLLQKED